MPGIWNRRVAGLVLAALVFGLDQFVKWLVTGPLEIDPPRLGLRTGSGIRNCRVVRPLGQAALYHGEASHHRVSCLSTIRPDPGRSGASGAPFGSMASRMVPPAGVRGRGSPGGCW